MTLTNKHLIFSKIAVLEVLRNRLFKNIGLSIISQAFAFLLNIISVPILLNYLGKESYGIWLTLFSLISWLSILDLGLGNGLRNHLTESLSRNNIISAKKYVSTTYILLGSIIFLMLIFLQLSVQFIDWNLIFKPSKPFPAFMNTVMSVCIWGTGLLLFLRIITSVLQATKEVGMSNFILVLGSLLAFGLLISIQFMNAKHKLTNISIIYSFSTPLVLLLYSIFYFKKRRPDLAPSWKNYDNNLKRNILGLGFSFFFSQFLVLFLNQSSNIIITQVLSPSDVTIYYLPSRLFSVISILLGIISTNLLPYFTEAHARKDVTYIKRTIRRFFKIYFIFIALSLILTILSKQIFHIWIQNKLEIPFSLVCFQFLLVAIGGLNSIYSTILNGIGRIKAQLPFLFLSVLLFIPLSIYLGKNLKLNGIAISVIIAQIPVFISLYFQTRTYINSYKEL